MDILEKKILNVMDTWLLVFDWGLNTSFLFLKENIHYD